MSNRLRNFVYTFQQLSSRTTIHGLVHIFQSRNSVRQAFWLILFLVALSAGLFHTVKAMQKFMVNPVRSQLKPMTEKAVFPHITICNLKPVSEMLSTSGIVRDYINSTWESFDNWHREDRKRRPSENKIQFHERLRKVFTRFFQIMWVSADTRDIGHFDKTMILMCRYNGLTCDHRNFTLVQSSNFWNCYTFDINSENSNMPGIGGRGAELEMIAYADNYDNRLSLLKSSNAMPLRGTIYNRSRSVEESESYSISDYLLGENCVNQILRFNSFASGGLRIFIHERQNYPLLSSEFVDVQTGRSSIITLRPLRQRLVSGSSHKCSKPPHDKIKYVRYFAHGSQDIGTREYAKTEKDFAVEAKQRIVYDNCGCYSHRYPFQVSTSQLCYYVSPEHWKSPPENVLRNIECHDRWILSAVSRSFELMEQFKEQSSCEYTRFRPWQQSISWPRNEHVVDIWEDLIVPQIEDCIEFLPVDQHRHHIFNYTSVYSGAYSSGATTRAEIMFFQLILSDINCFHHFCNITSSGYRYSVRKLRSSYKNAGKCVARKVLAQNMARIRIKLLSSIADVYEEALSYDWTEALSEVGGMLGLWVGASLLIVFEVMEFLYVIVVNCMRNEAANVVQSG